MRVKCLKFLLVFMAIMSASGVAIAQKTPTQQVDSSYVGWKKVQLKSFAFYLPDGFQQVQTKCTDSECYEFRSADVSLGIDVTPDAYRPNSEKEHNATYREKSVWLDKDRGIYAWIWSFERAEPLGSRFKYHSGVLFIFEGRPDYVVNMNILSVNDGVSEMAEKIFNSVKFNERRDSKN